MKLFTNFRSFFGMILGLIFNNWLAKLLSFLAATLFYLNLQASKILVKNIEIPIDYPRLSSSFIYGKNNPKTCKVKVEGFKDLVNYHSQFLKVSIDQNELRVGENIIEVKKYWGNSPKIKVTSEMETITVYVEHTYTKSIPVEVNFDGDLPNTLIKTSHTIKPSMITLSGTKDLLEDYTKFVIGKISLPIIKESTTISLKPPDPPQGINYIGPPREFQVRLNVLKSSSGSGEQIFGGIPLKCEGKNENLIAALSQEEVSIKFNSTIPINNIDIFQGIKATVPCNYGFDPKTRRILPNSYPATAKVRITKSNNLRSIEILSVVPEKVTIQYRIKNRDSEDSRIQDDPAFDDIIWPEKGEDLRYP